MATRIPVLGLVYVHEPKVGLVDQRSGLQRLSRLFVREFLRGELTQLGVDQWQELLSRGRVALFDRTHDSSDFAHGALDYNPPGDDSIHTRQSDLDSLQFINR